MDIKMVKNCLLVFLTAGPFPPSPTPQKKIQNEHIIGMVTWLNIPISQLLVPHKGEGKRH